ncbi:MAG: hypothetical protein MJ052_01410 [Sphaerochaetaceae bacterium]|nr:hypothetical protein [Sphaerochaetaceae bacterium]
MKKDVICKSIEVYGIDAQSTVCMEECAELIQAISKVKRYGINLDRSEHLAEEIADVTICIEMLKCMYGITSTEIENFIINKLLRLSKRMEG